MGKAYLLLLCSMQVFCLTLQIMPKNSLERFGNNIYIYLILYIAEVIILYLLYLFYVKKLKNIIEDKLRKIFFAMVLVSGVILTIWGLNRPSENLSVFNLSDDLVWIETVSFVITTIMAIGIYCFYIKKSEVITEYEYYREIPSNLSPAEVNMLLHGRVYIRDILATIMDLVRKKYLIVTGNENISRNIFLLFSKKTTEYIVSLDIENYKKNKHNLLLHEKYILKWFMENYSDDYTMNISEIQKFLQSEQIHMDEFKQKFLEWSQIVLNEVKNKRLIDYGFREVNKRILHIFLIIFIVLIFFYVVNAFPILVLAILLSKVRKTKTGLRQFYKWKGLKKFIEDYSLMNQAQVMSITIWEQYLVYSISFGIAKTTIDNFGLYVSNVDWELNDFVLF